MLFIYFFLIFQQQQKKKLIKFYVTLVKIITILAFSSRSLFFLQIFFVYINNIILFDFKPLIKYQL